MKRESFMWAFHPVRRLLLPGDPFFEEGNIQCNILRKQLNLEEDLHELIESSSPEFKCSVPGCSEYFISNARFETHYKAFHWNACRYCKKSFPSNHLLEIHLLENHDTLFQMTAMKKNMYRCLVESCPDKFSSEQERKDHLVKFHHYPADFRFNRPSRARRKAQKKLNAMEAKEGAVEPQAMEIGEPTSKENSSSTSSVPHRRLLTGICFGRGSPRAFQRGSISKRGGDRGGRKHKKNQKEEVSMDT